MILLALFFGWCHYSTAATGGNNISADNVGGTFTTLTGPIFAESAKGDIGTGTIVLNAPSGFIFDVGGTPPTVLVTGDATFTKNINNVATGNTIPVSRTLTSLTISILTKSNGGDPNTLTWQNTRVRPTAGAPLASGQITLSTGAGQSSFATNPATPNYGILTEVAGIHNRLAFVQQPSNANAGAILTPAVTIQIQDQFGNSVSTIRNVSLSVNNSGVLAGTTTVSSNASGLATFSNITITPAGNYLFNGKFCISKPSSYNSNK